MRSTSGGFAIFAPALRLGELVATLALAQDNASGQPLESRLRLPQARPTSGLTNREVEVLRLAAQGLTTSAIAERLYISAKAADHHIQHLYTKIGVSTRGAAALWAIQQGLVS